MYLETPRLTLQPINENALDALADLLSDPIVTQTYMVPAFSSRQEALTLAQRLKVLSEDPQFFLAGIYLAQQLIGILNETDRQGQQIEIGYALLPAYHNQGYATEALSGAIGYLLQGKFSSVLAGAFEENTASIRVMEKSGMIKLPQQDTIIYREKTHTCLYYCAYSPHRPETCIFL